MMHSTYFGHAFHCFFMRCKLHVRLSWRSPTVIIQETDVYWHSWPEELSKQNQYDTTCTPTGQIAQKPACSSLAVLWTLLASQSISYRDRQPYRTPAYSMKSTALQFWVPSHVESRIKVFNNDMIIRSVVWCQCLKDVSDTLASILPGDTYLPQHLLQHPRTV
jgi:hypothetical protein